jgi:pilus assembly protein Flp/PilA
MLSIIANYMSNWMRKEEGQDLTEYALIIALIVIAAVAAVTLLGTNISTVLNKVATTLTGVMPQ